MRKVTLATEESWAKIRDSHELTVGGQRKIQQAVVRVSPEAQETMRRNEKRRKGTEAEPLVLSRRLPSVERRQRRLCARSGDRMELRGARDHRRVAGTPPSGLREAARHLCAGRSRGHG